MPTGYQEEEVSRKEKESSCITEGRGLGSDGQEDKVRLGTENGTEQNNQHQRSRVLWKLRGGRGFVLERGDICSNGHPDTAAMLKPVRRHSKQNEYSPGRETWMVRTKWKRYI